MMFEDYDPRFVRLYLEGLSYERLLDLDPNKLGFEHIGDALMYAFHQELLYDVSTVDIPQVGQFWHPRTITSITRKVNERIARQLENMPEHKAVFENRYKSGRPTPESEIDVQVQRLVDREVMSVVMEVTDYWRQRGKL